MATIGGQLYTAIPFAVELRCLLDYAFAKTALDAFQFWQLFMYHFDLYNNKNGNYWYNARVFGSKSDPVDKFVFGGLITGVILVILIGPFYFFSEFSSFIEPNPVQSGEIEIRLNIKKRVSYADIMNEAKGNSEQALNANVRSNYDETNNACAADDASASQRDGIEFKTYYELAGSNCRLLCDRAPNCYGFEFHQSTGAEGQANCV